MHGALYHDVSDQPFTGVVLGYRFPGYESPDYAAGQILSDVLSSQRSAFGGLAFTGKALGTEFVTQSYPKAAIAHRLRRRAGDDARRRRSMPELRAIIAQYQEDGRSRRFGGGGEAARDLAARVQRELDRRASFGVEPGRRGARALVARCDDRAVSSTWRSRTSNRVLRALSRQQARCRGLCRSENNGAVSSGSAQMAKENNEIPPSKHEPLPPWAQHVLDHLSVPEQTLAPVDMRLANGIRLIVQPETITHTVVVEGQIQNNPDVQEPPGKEGVADVTDSLFPYGTTTYDRVAYQAQLDEIAADVDAGTGFRSSTFSPRTSSVACNCSPTTSCIPAFNARRFWRSFGSKPPARWSAR